MEYSVSALFTGSIRTSIEASSYKEAQAKVEALLKELEKSGIKIWSTRSISIKGSTLKSA